LVRSRHFSLTAEALNDFSKRLQHTEQTIGAAATQDVFDFTVRISALVPRAQHRRNVADSYRRVALRVSDSSTVWIA
jgi:hypothetical protein